MEPFALFNLLQSLLSKKPDVSPSENAAAPTSENTETIEEQSPTAPERENAAARFLDEHDKRARRLKK